MARNFNWSNTTITSMLTPIVLSDLLDILCLLLSDCTVWWKIVASRHKGTLMQLPIS